MLVPRVHFMFQLTISDFYGGQLMGIHVGYFRDATLSNNRVSACECLH